MSTYAHNKLIFLAPLSFLYSIGVGFRNWLFDVGILPTQKYEIPIISIGNITVGGTGKTPHTEYLLSLLHATYKTAMLSRGYKRLTKGYVLANNNSNCLEIGDEPFQIKQKFFDVLVAVDANRRRGIQHLLNLSEDIKPEVIVLDDAFQHRYVEPGISILLTDYNRLITDDSLLPVGQLRESAKNRSRANIVIVTKCPDNATPIDYRIITKKLHLYPYQNLYFSKYHYGEIQPVFPSSVAEETPLLKKELNILLVTGIVSQRYLLDYLTKFTKKIQSIEYPDHHYFTALDLEHISKEFDIIHQKQKIILVTEKDAARLINNPAIPESLQAHLYYIPLTVSFLFGQETMFNTQILDYVRKNKTNHGILKK
jgi:tetraacyldisaccharide 4'-kinase